MRTFTKHYVRILAVAATLSCAPLHAAWQYAAVEFPDDDVVLTSLWGVNDSGDAVGFAFDVLSDVLIHPFPFVYDTRTGTYTRLPRAFGEEFGTLGFGINNRGAVAGVRFAPPDGADHGVIRSKQGAYTEFAHPASLFLTDARGINDRGLVAGVSDNGSYLLGFIYDPASDTYVDFLPSPDTVAHGINDRGEVAGSVFLDAGVACAQCPEGIYGYLRTARGAFSFFRVNGADTRARGLSDSGVIAGQVDTATGVESFVTRIQGLPYEAITIPEANLLRFPGKDVTAAEGINNRGDVVGFYEDETGRHGFFARQTSH